MLIRYVLTALFLGLTTLGNLPAFGATPNLGEHAPDFTLMTPDGAPVSLQSLTARQRTVLVVLRGYPGYQCPYCQRQVQDFLSHADAFAQAHAQVLMVYPGPRAQLTAHAKEFLDNRTLPPAMHLVVDPDYQFTGLYDLRWNAPGETAYPATFIINRDGMIAFRKISHSHGDRVTATEVLSYLAAKHPH